MLDPTWKENNNIHLVFMENFDILLILDLFPFISFKKKIKNDCFKIFILMIEFCFAFNVY